MNRSLGFAAIFMALSAGSAHSADVMSDPAYDWTGFYSGVTLGYSEVDGNYFADTDGDFGLNADSVRFGTLSGYNFQFDNIVFGLESDTSLGTLKDTEPREFKIGIESTLRARLGMSFDRVLPFVTAGIALADASSREDGVGKDSNYHLGLAVGGGLEFAATEHLRLRGEYLYESFGKETYDIGAFNDTAEWDQHIARAAVIWAW